MRFHQTRFDRMLSNMGQQMLYWRAWGCSCVNAASGAPDPKCQLCLGKGHFYDSPVPTRAAQASQKIQGNWAKGGRFETGDLVLSVPSTSAIWAAGQFDRVTMLDADERFSMPMTRGAPTERLPFKVKDIARVFWKHPQTGVLVEGGIPTFDPKTGRPAWTDREPPAGVTYSLTGNRFVEYFIYQDLPTSRAFHDGTQLPKHVVLRKYDLLGRRVN